MEWLFLTPSSDIASPQFLRYSVRLGRAGNPSYDLHPCHRISLSEPVDTRVSISTAPRKVYDTRDDDRTAGVHGDCDDDKYRRRPALGWLAQLLRYTGPRVGRQKGEAPSWTI